MDPKRNGLGLSDLLDSLLTSILSKVPLKQAVHCSVLSKRWKFLWTFLPNLKFLGDFFSPSCSPVAFQNIIDSIFKLHSSPLELFEFNNIPSCFTSEKICEWICRAALKEVREISIEESASESDPKVEVPISIFFYHKLRSLALNNFSLTKMPDYFSGFAGLATLNFDYVKMNDTTLELMVELCPVMEILILRKCYGLKRVKICSESLISLNLSSGIEAITAICPRLVSLRIMFANLGDTEFYLPECLHLCTDVNSYQELKVFTALKSLRKITLLYWIDEGDGETLSKFPDFEQLCMGSDWDPREFLEVTFLLENLKQVHLDLTSSSYDDAIPLLAYLLGHAPAMKTLLVSRRSGFGAVDVVRFVNQLMNLPRPSTDTKILLSHENFKETRCVDCDLEKFI